jgi:hypothetical protein
MSKKNGPRGWAGSLRTFRPSTFKVLPSIWPGMLHACLRFRKSWLRPLLVLRSRSLLSDRSFACSSGNLVSKHLRTRSARAIILFSERFHRSLDWILVGEGKWLRPAPGRCSPRLVTDREEGFNGNRNQRNYLSTMERGKVEVGAEILLRISREFGKSIEWLLTG